jgi:hypothetical protein
MSYPAVARRARGIARSALRRSEMWPGIERGRIGVSIAGSGRQDISASFGLKADGRMTDPPWVQACKDSQTTNGPVTCQSE